MANTYDKITPLVITGLDWFEAIETAAALEGCQYDTAADEIRDWCDENAVAFAIKYAREGRADDAEELMGMYDGDQRSDPANVCYDPKSPWNTAAAEIRRARAVAKICAVAANEEEPETITRTALSGFEYTEKNIDLAETVAERSGIPVHLEADPAARILRATGTAAAIEDFFQLCRETRERNEALAHTPAYAEIEEYLGCPEGEFLKGILEEAAEDARRDHTNLFKAGYFEGAARMLAAAIVNDGAAASVAELTRAAYQYCGLPW